MLLYQTDVPHTAIANLWSHGIGAEINALLYIYDIYAAKSRKSATVQKLYIMNLTLRLMK